MPHDDEEIVARPRSSSSISTVQDVYFGNAEKTVTESSQVAESFFRPFNPDDLWQKRGDYDIYEEMALDDQAGTAMQLKFDLVVGSGWSIVPEEGQDDIARELAQSLEEDPEVPLDDQIEEMIRTGYLYGFAITEKIFQLKADNFLTLNRLKTTHPNSWRLHTNKKGHVVRYEQHGSEADLTINPDSIIHYVNQRQWQNPYGRSDLRRAFDAWTVKRHIIRFYAIFLEKYASPIPIAKYEPGKVPQDKVDEMFNIIKAFQQKTAMVVPKNFELEFIESSNKGEAYTAGINLFNMFIGRALLIPDLIGFSGSESQSGGSQALGREQMNIFFMHINRRRKTIERLINKHIVQPMAIWNYGLTEGFPKFKFDPISDDDTEAFARMFLEAVKGRVYKPSEEEINHFRNLIKFPEGAFEEADPEPSPFGPTTPQPDTANGKVDVEGTNAPEEKTGNLDETQKFAFKPPAGGFHKRVDFQALDSQLTSGLKKVDAEARPLIDDIFEDLFSQIQKKKILNNDGNIARIDTIKLKKLNSFQNLLKKSFRQHWNDSRILAKSELIKQTFKSQDPKVIEYRKKVFVNELASEEFLEFLEQETFQFIGDWETNVTKGARQAMMNAIRDGKPLSSVIDLIGDKTKRASLVSLERFARTKFTDVMNRARVAEFEESGVVDGFQYSAILDDRTTTICAGLHGKTFKAGTEPLPPMHFNCRSTLIPITIFEEFEPSTSVGKRNIDKFIDDEKGEGFAKR